jgi:hypothetical protein
MFPEQAADYPRTHERDPYRAAIAASLLARGLPLDLLRFPEQAVGAIAADAARFAADTPDGPVSIVSYSEQSDEAEAGAFVSLQIGDEPLPTHYTADASNPYRSALAITLGALGLPHALLGTPRHASLAIVDKARQGGC